ncbi:YlbF family regulator [Anaeromassilibacillus senegalensis]|uniref:YlbF family regulator n=1 Tax=Anaeromassilibacillus senegalensis TaxID=1673717 RepID=A0ABS9CN83_9FIRM|nr:YlbF family regulator [Anaeromassilibacillus senegalensis]MCF2651795.1 YlbF family regulator [Anaeromassilibacillus senegalensis]MCI5651833.1 YlbF family regulator [Ruminococcus bromii]
MDIIELARELGKAIQQEQAFINMRVACQQSDEDEELQNMIGEFNLKRMAINNEVQKEDRSEETLKKYNDELRAIYAEIMQNPHMAAYNEAKNELDALVQRVTNIITMSADGEDPDSCDCDSCGCTGSCASCGGGCH